MHGKFRSNCHTIKLSFGTSANASIASMPAAARSHCILLTRDLRMLAIFSDLPV